MNGKEKTNEIIISGIATLIVKKQNIREVLYFMMAGGVILKIFTVEVTRMIILIKG